MIAGWLLGHGSQPLTLSHLRRMEHIPAWLKLTIIVGLTLIYALCYATIKAGLAFAPPLRFAGWRALLGGAALLVLAATRGGPTVPAPRQWPWILGLGLLATTVSFAGMFLSPGRTSTGVASVLGNTQPLMLVMLGTLLLGEDITARKLLALGLGLAGVVTLSYPAWSVTQGSGISGPLLALAASGGAAAGSVIVKRMAPGRHLLAVSAWQLLVGSLPLFLWSAIAEPNASISWSGQFVAVLLFLALFGTSLVTAAWYWLIQHEDVGRLSLFLFLVPLFGLAIGAAFLGERVTMLAEIGAMLAVGGTVLAIKGG
jgi:drug/metabolite transporter (DMT)-like permease